MSLYRADCQDRGEHRMAHPESRYESRNAGATAVQADTSAARDTESGLDPIEAYFECITTCSLDDGECVTSCTEILREHG
jgi:hypothetical protein